MELLSPKSHSELIQKLPFQFDLNSIQTEVRDILAGLNGLEDKLTKQVMLTCREKSTDPNFEGIGKLFDHDKKQYRIPQEDFCCFNPHFQGGYLHQLWKSFPFAIGRVRIMMLPSHFCYSVHTDQEPRFHLAVTTNPDCFITYPNTPHWYQIPTDGHLYLVHTNKPHTALNAGQKYRIHLVFDSTTRYSELS